MNSEPIIILLMFIVLFSLFKGFHRIEEGDVGAYYTNGVLSTTISEPGFHF